MPAIIGIIVALIVGYFGFSGTQFFSRGPLATGPGRGTDIQNPQPVGSRGFFGFGEPSPPPAPRRGESPFKGKIRISTVQRSSDRPEGEYALIRHGGFFSSRTAGEQPIDVTGWTIGSIRGSEPIPRAFNIPEIDAAVGDVILPPGGEVIILSGTPSYQQSFRENQCVGYFNETHPFTPSLSNSCIDDNSDRSELLQRGFNGACVDAIHNVSACRMPQGPFPVAAIKKECVDYMNENFSYVGCVKNFRDRKDFLKNTWRVSLKRGEKLFDPRHDRVILRDQNGLLVDEFEY